jgi:predicted MFS family arabinose efflux permease
MTEFRRDRLTWVAYVMLAWFAYLQAAPGQVIAHLRDELHLSYAVGGLHVAAFAGGSMVSGVLAARLERAAGRRTLLWSGAAVMAAGTVGLTTGRAAAVTAGSVLVMGLGGGTVLTTIQATLADHHGERRTVALAEANVAAAVAYVLLIGALGLASGLHAGWRTALLAALVVPVVVWWANRRVPIETPPAPAAGGGRLPPVFWIAVAMLFCMTAAEWCVASWGASFVEDAAGQPADTAVLLMAGYFGGVLAGRTAGSRLARRRDPVHLLAVALAVAGAGFGVLWTSHSAGLAVAGLTLLGLGLGNLFPMGVALTVSLAPDRAAAASGRTVAASSLAILFMPLAVGALADATSLTAALGVVPVALALAALGLVLVRRAQRRTAPPRMPGTAPLVR